MYGAVLGLEPDSTSVMVSTSQAESGPSTSNLRARWGAGSLPGTCVVHDRVKKYELSIVCPDSVLPVGDAVINKAQLLRARNDQDRLGVATRV